MKVTVKQFAELNGITAAEANGALNFLVKRGIVPPCTEHLPQVDAEGKAKRGKPSNVYDLPPEGVIIFG